MEIQVLYRGELEVTIIIFEFLYLNSFVSCGFPSAWTLRESVVLYSKIIQCVRPWKYYLLFPQSDSEKLGPKMLFQLFKFSFNYNKAYFRLSFD